MQQFAEIPCVYVCECATERMDYIGSVLPRAVIVVEFVFDA